MSKRRGGFPGGGTPGGGNMGLMKQLQKMQEDMAAAQEALASETVEVTAGGIVTVVMTGHQRVQSVTIKADVVDTSDPEWVSDLQDLVMVAVNQAIEQSQTLAAQRMESITGGLGDVPGLGGLLGG